MSTRSASEDRVRDEAYRLWEQAGRPHGRDAEFWHQASAMVERDSPAPAKAKAAAPAAKPRKKAAAPDAVTVPSPRKPRKAGGQPTTPSA